MIEDKISTRLSHGWLAFSLGLILTTRFTVAAPPTFFQVLDPVRPDETLLLFGADVGESAAAEGLRLPDTRVSGPPKAVSNEVTAKSVKLEMLQASDLSAKVLIPANWSQGIFAVRVRNVDGVSEWQIANRPQLWWSLAGDDGKASPGGELRVFGKNFGKEARLWLQDGEGHAQEIPLTVARDFDVKVKLPGDLKTGRYRIWLHNGHGGKTGFGEPLPIDISIPDQWASTVFNVAQFGVKRDGEHDDTEAIRHALAAAESNGGGIVYLPRGTYIITEKLIIPKRTILRGERRESVWLKVPFFWPREPQRLQEIQSVVAGNGDFGVENLSIVAQSARRLIAAPDVGDLYGPGMARVPQGTVEAPSVHLRNLRLQHLYYAHRRASDRDAKKALLEGPSTVVVNGSDFTLEDSEIISGGMPIQIQNATRARISRNVLRTGRNGWFGLWNSRQGVFEDNDIAGADLEGSYGAIEGSVSEMIFRGNHWHDAFGGEREALTFDAPYVPAWMGRVTMEGRRIFMGHTETGQWPPGKEFSGEQLLAVVASGRGVGQAVPVVAITTGEAVLAHAFSISPDPKSIVALCACKSRVLIVNNVVEDASVAFQLYSQAEEFIIADNRCVRTGGSYAQALDAIDHARRSYWYSLFNQWIDNTFEEGLVYDQGAWRDGFVGYTIRRSSSFCETTPAIGDRFENNRLTAGTHMGATGEADVAVSDSETGVVPAAREAIFEKNFIAERSIGIGVDAGHWFTLLRRNRFQGVDVPISNGAKATVILDR